MRWGHGDHGRFIETAPTGLCITVELPAITQTPRPVRSRKLRGALLGKASEGAATGRRREWTVGSCMLLFAVRCSAPDEPARNGALLWVSIYSADFVVTRYPDNISATRAPLPSRICRECTPAVPCSDSLPPVGWVGGRADELVFPPRWRRIEARAGGERTSLEHAFLTGVCRDERESSCIAAANQATASRSTLYQCQPQRFHLCSAVTQMTALVVRAP